MIAYNLHFNIWLYNSVFAVKVNRTLLPLPSPRAQTPVFSFMQSSGKGGLKKKNGFANKLE